MREILKEGLLKLKFDFDDKILDKFIKYAEFLVSYNQNVNLTAITEPKEIAVKHFLDSAALLCALNIPAGAKIIDVGSGAGFPGLVLKLLRKDINLYLLDSLQKRIEFLRQCGELLDLDNIELLHLRAEDGGRDKSLREKFDFAVARAVAPLEVLSEYCLPFVKVGGCFAAQKGPNLSGELEEAKSAIKILGGGKANSFLVEIPFSDLRHNIVVIRKERQTPTLYPRKAGKPSKNPLK